METNDIVREVAKEMLNTSMQDITAERINGWATRLGEVATCKESRQVQTMDEWTYPLTNVCKCGNGQEPKTCATVKDANGVVLLHFNGIPWRSNKDSTAMATEFCERMNAQGNKVGNAAAMREALLEIIDCAKDVSERNLSYIEHQARQALSTPPRNCDLYATPKEAGDAFVSETCETPCEVCSVSDRFHNPLIHECGINWLFAEVKGEAK